MTLSTATSRVAFATNGTTGPFTVPFYFLNNAHLLVVYTTSAGVETTLILNTDYTVSGAGDSSGGAVTTTTAYPAGGSLTIIRAVPITQETDYANQDAFPAESHEDALDKLTMIVQQLDERLDRALVMSTATTGSGELPTIDDRKNKYLSFDSSGNVTATAPSTGTALELAADLLAAGATDGAAMVGYLPAGTGADNRTVQDKLRDFVSVLDFPGNDLGERLQAAYDARLAKVQTGDGLGAGIFILIPPNPDGDHWVLSTAVDLSSGGFCHVMGVAGTYIELGANLTYMIQFGVTAKSNRTILENITFKPAAFSADCAIRIGGGTQCELRGISFQKSADAGSFTNGILVDRALDPTGAGLTYSSFQNIHDTGGTACTNAMIKASGLISCLIQHMRVGGGTTYGIELSAAGGDVQGNVIDSIHGEAGVGTSTALVRLDATTNGISLNTIRGLVGNNVVDYGISCTGAQSIDSNVFDVNSSGFTSGVLDDDSVPARKLNLVRESGAFTSTWEAVSVNPALGDGTLVAKYYREGKTVTVTYKLTAGSTTTFGTGQYTLTLPEHLTAGATYDWHGVARAYDAAGGTTFAFGSAQIVGGASEVTAAFPATYWGPTVPHTWAASDRMEITITYGI